MKRGPHGGDVAQDLAAAIRDGLVEPVVNRRGVRIGYKATAKGRALQRGPSPLRRLLGPLAALRALLGAGR